MSPLPLDVTRGASTLDVALPGLAPGPRLPIDTGVSTGRATDLATAGQGGIDLAGLLDYQPTTSDRVKAFGVGLGSNDPGAAAKALDTLTETKRKAGMDLLNYQLNFMKFLREGSEKSMTSFNTFLTGLKTLAESAAGADPEQMTLAVKGLKQGAREGGIQWAESLVEPMLARPDVAKVFPDLVPFIRQPAAQVIGLRLPQLLKDGKAEVALWAAAAPEIQAQADQRVGQVLATLKARPEYQAQPIPFDLVVDLASQGNRVLGDYLYNRLPKDVADTIGSARASFLDRLASHGVALPSTAAKAQEIGATTAAAKRAALAPDIVTGEAAAAAEKARAQEIAKLAAKPFGMEEERLKLQKLRNEVEQGNFAGLTETVTNYLKADPAVTGKPTQAQVQRAIERSEGALLDRSRQQGLAAANIPARTPEAEMKGFKDLALAQSQLEELGRLTDKVNLPKIAGGLAPWLNKISETGRVGPLPVDMRGLAADDRRFLALTRDYADTVLRMRSGAQINEQEFARMLGFLPVEQATPATVRTRLTLQRDLLRARQDIQAQTLQAGGYRAPRITPPALGGGAGGWKIERVE